MAGTNYLGEALETILHRPHLRRTATIAVLVGTWLTIFNQGDVIVGGTASTLLVVKICLNYVSPFIVANLGLLSSERAKRSKA